MLNVGERIRYAREKSGMTQGELADKIGVQRAVISKYETGYITTITATRFKELAEALSVSPAYLMGWEDTPIGITAKDAIQPALDAITGFSVEKKKKIPVFGHVRAGIPLDAVEEIFDYEEISEDMAAGGEYFALQIKGDSMEPKFSEGDVVIVRKQSDVDSGNIAVILVNGDGATVKKIKKRDDGVELIPTNPMYDVMLFNREQIETLPVRIIGKVVELRAKF